MLGNFADADDDRALTSAEARVLRDRLHEAEETLRALRSGDVDAVIVDADSGPRIYTLQGLEAESNRFRGDILDSVSDAVIAVDQDQRITYLNRACERMYGVRAEAVLGRLISELYHEVVTAAAGADDASASTQAREWRADCMHELPDGRRLWVDVRRSAYDNGDMHGTLSVTRDITDRVEYDRALRESEQRLRLALQAGRMATWDWDTTTGAVAWNREHYTLLGLDPAQHTPSYEQWASRVHPEDLPRVEQRVARSVEQGSEFHAEYRVRAQHDEWRWVEAWGSAHRVGADVRSYGIMVDATARKQSEDLITANARLFARIIEEAPGAVYVVDERMAFHAVNDAARALFAPLVVAPGMSFVATMRTMWGEARAAEMTRMVTSTLEHGDRHKSALLSADRHDVALQQTLEWETLRIVLPDGNAGVACYCVDLTERARAAEVARDSDARARLATEVSGVGIWEWNLKTGAVRWDPRVFEMYGITPTPTGEVTFDDWLQRVVPDERDEQVKVLEDTVARRGRSEREFRIRRLNDGELRVIRAVDVVRSEPSDDLEWFVGTNLDITEQRAAELALQEADRRKDEFLATLAHELRNPLAPVRNSVQVLQMMRGGEPIVQRSTDIIERQVRQMTRLIDELMDVSRVNQSKVVLQREVVRLQDVLHTALETSRPLIDDGAHTLDLRIDDERLFVDVDPTRLAQVVLNLLNNAAKYTPRGGRIGLAVERRGSDLVITVTDNGIGIREESLAQIFGMFSQVESVYSRSHGGLGIGLYLVRRLVEMHGGTVTASSAGEGRGSEFVVRMPVITSAPDDLAPIDADHDVGAQHARTILVVDDNRDTAESLAHLLDLAGFGVRLAHDGPTALDVAARGALDAIVLDIGLPGMSGYDVARRIRALPQGRDICLIAVTGWGQDADRSRAVDAGFDRHLVKPVDVQEIIRTLSTQPAR